MLSDAMQFECLDAFRHYADERVKGHHLQLRFCPPLFHDFKQFNIKAATTHHPIIQKKVHELLAKDAIEPLTDDPGLYSNVFVVPKHTGGLQPILKLNQFNHYMHIPTFKMPDRYGNLFNKVIMLFLLISRMLIYIFLL